ncbi:hypothetical protein T4A_6976 [Trichinella pseudospiralis]|uniref:C2H2-type domain-containing protein n=1 Tax=Trichinella pseudospiralis TaxID=6337 RepID=A0A0V1E2W4_TRIPS|nr:hypothetical protein T4A_6976 [Trichinella pseudospiralis]
MCLSSFVNNIACVADINEDVIITESLLHLMSASSTHKTEKISQCNRLLQHLDATGANCTLKKFDCIFCGEKSYSNFRMIVHKCEQHEMNIDEPKMICPECKGEFHMIEEYQSHIKIHGLYYLLLTKEKQSNTIEEYKTDYSTGMCAVLAA